MEDHTPETSNDKGYSTANEQYEQTFKISGNNFKV